MPGQANRTLPVIQDNVAVILVGSQWGWVVALGARVHQVVSKLGAVDVQSHLKLDIHATFDANRVWHGQGHRTGGGIIGELMTES